MGKRKPVDKKDVIPESYLKQIRLRHEELNGYGFDWKSFYNGAIEGFYIAYISGLITADD